MKKILIKHKYHLIIFILICLLFYYVGCIFYYFYHDNKENKIYIANPIINNISINYVENIAKVTINVDNSNKCFIKNNDGTITTTITTYNDMCQINLHNGEYIIYTINSFNKQSVPEKLSIDINHISKVNIIKEIIYLPLNSSKDIDYDYKTVGDPEIFFNWKSSEKDIVSVTDGKITGLKNGKATITISTKEGITDEVEVIVTDLITESMENNNKKYVECNEFTDEEAKLLDEMLADRVNDAGYGTRAGVVAAARFLLLEFNRKVNYFYENGRLTYSGRLKLDGEGRYYHKGLYVSTDKYSSLYQSLQGPQSWGCSLKKQVSSNPVKYNFPDNGLDCSGFVSWAFLNGGIDIGDYGATMLDNILSKSGERLSITKSLMDSNRLKVGDFIGISGHAALIIGLDETNVYIAESLASTKGVKLRAIAKSKLPSSPFFKFVILLDNYYAEDGNLTNMWY